MISSNGITIKVRGQHKSGIYDEVKLARGVMNRATTTSFVGKLLMTIFFSTTCWQTVSSTKKTVLVSLSCWQSLSSPGAVPKCKRSVSFETVVVSLLLAHSRDSLLSPRCNGLSSNANSNTWNTFNLLSLFLADSWDKNLNYGLCPNTNRQHHLKQVWLTESHVCTSTSLP